MLRTLEGSELRGSEALTWPSIARASSQLRRRHPLRIEGAGGTQPTLLQLGTLFVAGEVVVVSGSVSQEAAAGAKLEINGSRVPIEASGSFCASVPLEAEATLTLSLATDSPETIRMQIPLRAAAPPAAGMRLVSA
jgi:hypothetical protein